MKQFAAAALALACGIVTIGPAAGRGVVIADRATLMSCLCSQQGLTILLDRVDVAKQIFEEDQAEIASLDRQIEAARTSVEVASPSQVAALKAMNLQRAQLYARTYDVDFPRAQEAVRIYDAASGRYQSHCVGQNFDSVQMQQAQANLSCPELAPPQ
jgi:hypothetical protein